jgi:O-antigen/teichoic acid export membrane protein
MATARQAVRGVFWGVVERASSQGIAFLVLLVLARLLGPENYGLVTLAATMALFGQMLLGETFSQALIQQKLLERAHVSSLFWLLASSGLIAAGILWLASDVSGEIFAQPRLAPILKALSPLLFLSALQAVPIALFRRDLDFRAFAVASVLGTVAGGATGIGLAALGFGAWSLVANLLGQSAVTTAVIWRQSRFRPELVFSRPHIRDLWVYGQYTFFLRIAAFIANQSPRILIGYLFGPLALGVFSLALRMVEILYQLLSLPAVNVAMPAIAKVRDAPERLERAILTATQLSAMVSVPVFVGLALIAPFAVPVVFGAKWTASVPIVQILCVYGIVGTCGLIWGSIIAGLGRPDIALATTSTAAAVNIAVLLLIAPWGIVAASAAFVVRGYATLPFMPFVIARLTGIHAAAQYRVFAPIAFATAIMAAAVESLIAALGNVLPPTAMTAAAIALGIAVYVGAVCLLARPAVKVGVSFLAQWTPNWRTA